MTLNCLACQSLQRSDSENGKTSNFSGKLAHFLNDKTIKSRPSLPLEKKPKKGHRRLHSTEVVVYEGTGEPKLVRSSGIRRDWSFQEMRKKQDHGREDFEKAKKGHRRLYSTGVVVYGGTGEPKLARSSGIGRDWNFEDIRKKQDNKREGFKKAKKGHRRLYSTGDVVYEVTGEPKLVRSSGLRRDWSFGDLRKK